MLFDELFERAALLRAAANGCFIAGHARDFPAFAYLARRVREVLEFGDFLATPNGGFEECFEFKRFHSALNKYIRVSDFRERKGHPDRFY